MDYRITVTIKDVTEGDVSDVAQSIWDEHARALDADRGDFLVEVSRVEGRISFDTDWVPAR